MAKAYALLGTYPPTQCGLATFGAALSAHLRGPGDHVGIVRVLDEPVPGEPPPQAAPEVVHDLVNGSGQSAAAAIKVINGFDVAIVQHEYGIYGGPDGQDLVPLLYALRVPSIVVLHTVLAQPTTRQRAILDDIIDAASAVVTMTRTARTRLLDIYGTSPGKVFVIPHGSADNRAVVAPREASHPPMALTWGLLGPGKGIEHAIAAGKPVISTAFPHAVEVLAGGAGLLVGRQDPAAIASALDRVFTEPGLSGRMSRRAADLAPQLLWPAVALSYRDLAVAVAYSQDGAVA